MVYNRKEERFSDQWSQIQSHETRMGKVNETQNTGRKEIIKSRVEIDAVKTQKNHSEKQ